jgi:hypothetical protein
MISKVMSSFIGEVADVLSDTMDQSSSRPSGEGRANLSCHFEQRPALGHP